MKSAKELQSMALQLPFVISPRNTGKCLLKKQAYAAIYVVNIFTQTSKNGKFAKFSFAKCVFVVNSPNFPTAKVSLHMVTVNGHQGGMKQFKLNFHIGLKYTHHVNAYTCIYIIPHSELIHAYVYEYQLCYHYIHTL